MLNSAEKQSLFVEDNCRRTSSSFVEEFFEVSSDDRQIIEKPWIKHEPADKIAPNMEAFDQEPVDVFEIDSTMYDSVMRPGTEVMTSLSSGMNTNSSQSIASSSLTSSVPTDSVWEALTESWNMLDNTLPCSTSSISHFGTLPCGSSGIQDTFTIKSEPMDSEEKPSCQYGLSSSSVSHSSTAAHPNNIDNFLFNTHSSSSYRPPNNSISIANSLYKGQIPQTKLTSSLAMPTDGRISSSSRVVMSHSASNSGGIVSIGSGAQIPNSGFIPANSHFKTPSANFASASPVPHVVPSLFLPLTPPNSQPGSPNNDGVRKTPPPPYPGINSQIPRPVLSPAPSSLPVTVTMVASHAKSERPRKQPVTHPGCSTIKYNRKNNPELEKRRIHFCSFPGRQTSE